MLEALHDGAKVLQSMAKGLETMVHPMVGAVQSLGTVLGDHDTVWFGVIVLLGLHVVGFFIWLLLCGSQKIDDAQQFREFKQSKKEM